MCENSQSKTEKRKRIDPLFIAGVAIIAAIVVGVILLIIISPVKENTVPDKSKNNAKTEQTQTVDETEKKSDAEGTADTEEIEVILESQMSDATQAEIKTITDTFLSSLNGRNAALIMDYLIEDFGATQGQLNGFFRTATGNGKAPYTLHSTYYVKDVEDPQETLQVKKSENDNVFALFSAGGQEACVALFSSESEKISQMISIVITRVDNKMKIAYMDTTDSGYYGKTAPEYFEMAKAAKESGKDASAYVYAQMMYNICQPGTALYYDETEAMVNYIGEMSNWHGEVYPKQIVDEAHTIHMIGLALEDVGVVPMIFYQTETDIASADIQADAEKVKDAFLKENPDIAETFSKIVIHASNVTLSEATDDSSYKKIVFDIK